MWTDEIVQEVRKEREAHAARFNYDLEAIWRDLKEQERQSGRKVVSPRGQMDKLHRAPVA
jgi:hypothetical protein